MQVKSLLISESCEKLPLLVLEKGLQQESRASAVLNKTESAGGLGRVPTIAQSLTGKREFPAAVTSSPSPDYALPSCQSPSQMWAGYRRSRCRPQQRPASCERAGSALPSASGTGLPPAAPLQQSTAERRGFSPRWVFSLSERRGFFILGRGRAGRR